MHQPLAYTAVSLLMWSTDAFLLYIDVDELLLIPKPERRIHEALAAADCGRGCVCLCQRYWSVRQQPRDLLPASSDTSQQRACHLASSLQPS